MLKIKDQIQNFKYNTAYKDNIDYLDSKKNKIGILLFLRYYGCRICQLDIKDYNDTLSTFTQNNIDLKIVLQSTRETMKDSDKIKQLSVEIICDPEQELYKKFQVKAANSKEELSGNGRILDKVNKAAELGFIHGKYEGNELQLPAIFITDTNNKIVYIHYAKDGADIPTSLETLNIIKKLQL